MRLTIRVSLLLTAPAFLAAQSTASIQGAVTDRTSNKPIPSAFVTAVRTGLPPASQTVQSARDGSFQLQNLPAGTYSLCVQVPGEAYVDPCRWEAKPASVTLANGQKVTATSLRILSGSTLKIRINDPAGIASQKTRDGRDPDLMMGVFGPRSLFYPAHGTGKDASGADYQLTIPKDLPVTFSIGSQSLKLGDSTGAALPSNTGQQSLQHRTGDANPQSFTFTVLTRLP